jgi:purine-binding chemotaxis protein CheW
MIQDAKAFLKDLQSECIKEGNDYINRFREELINMKTNPLACLNALLKILHSMKGNFQASAFLHYANYVHELESILDKKSTLLHSAVGQSILESDVLDFEFLMSNTISAMQSYLEKLELTFEDTEVLLNERKETLTALDVWDPTFKVSFGIDTNSRQIQISEKIDNDRFASVEESDFFASDSSSSSKINVIPTNEVVTANEVCATNEAVTTNEINAANKVNANTEVSDNITSVTINFNESQNNLLYLLFQHSKKYFAIEISHVVEVIKSQPLSSPPFKRVNLCGLLNLRGEVLPILEVPQIGSHDIASSVYTVISQVDDLRFGFLVESVHQVISLNSKNFQVVKGIENTNFSNIKCPRFFQLEEKTISIISAIEILLQLDNQASA